MKIWWSWDIYWGCLRDFWEIIVCLIYEISFLILSWWFGLCGGSKLYGIIWCGLLWSEWVCLFFDYEWLNYVWWRMSIEWVDLNWMIECCILIWMCYEVWNLCCWWCRFCLINFVENVFNVVVWVVCW